MKECCVLFAVFVVGFPPSLGAQPAGEKVLSKEDDPTVQESQFRATRDTAPLWKSASLPNVSSESGDEEQLQKDALESPSDDWSNLLSVERDNDTAGKGDDESGRDELFDFDFGDRLEAAGLPGDLDGGSGAQRQAGGEARVTESGVDDRIGSLDSRVSISDKDRTATEDRRVPSFGERMEAMMQSLVGADFFSALRHFEDVLAPINFTGPRVTTGMDENNCIFEVNLENLPERASLSVSVESGRVFVEYANSVQEVSGEREGHAKGKETLEDELAKQESSRLGEAASPGYSVGRADVFSLESFPVPSACDHESDMAKAARVDRDKLVIKFPRMKTEGNFELPTQAASSETGVSGASHEPPGPPGDFQEASVYEKDGNFATESPWTTRLPFATRFMHEKGRTKSSGKPTGLAGPGVERPNAVEKAPAEATGRRRYIPLVHADDL